MTKDVELLRKEFWQVHNKFVATMKKSKPLRDEYNRLVRTHGRGNAKIKAQADKIRKAEAEIPKLAQRRSEITRLLGRDGSGVAKVGANV